MFYLLTNQVAFRKLVCETGLSDCHNMILTIFRSKFVKLPPKTIKYRSYMDFSEPNFCQELDQILIKRDIYKSEDPYSEFTHIFSEILNKDAPLKSKQVRGNQAPFMNKELSKVIMNKSRLKNKYQKWPSRENSLAFKKIKNKCNNLIKRTYFENLSKNDNFATSKTFWNTVRPFITNKGTVSNENITIKAEEKQKVKIKNKNEHISIKKDEYINDENILVEMFNNHYINIVEKTSGKAPDSIGNSSLAENDSVTIDKIIKYYENHPSISKIKNNQNKNKTFEFPEAKVEDINKIIKSLNPKKVTGPDGIPIKVIMSANNVIDSHVTNIINQDLNIDKYSEEAKTALVTPLFKKDDRQK